MGETKENLQVGIVYQWKNLTGPKSSNGLVTLKKRGYPTTVHRFRIDFQYTSESAAAANPKRVVVVLDTE